jgi:hypothetical protein
VTAIGSDKKQKRIVIAGKEYTSVADMPPEMRRVYERARTSSTASDAPKVKIIYHGNEYASIDEMPAEIRQRYEHEQAAMETFRDFSVDSTVPRAIKVDQVRRQSTGTPPGSKAAVKWVVIGLMVLAVVLVAAYMVMKRG